MADFRKGDVPSPGWDPMDGSVRSVALADLDRARVASVVSPLSSALVLTIDALTDGERWGSPAWVRRAARAELRGRDLAAFAPFASRKEFPQLLEPIFAGGSISDQLEALVAIDPAALPAAIDATWAPEQPPSAWHAVQRVPARWLRAYAMALQRAWRGLEPLWVRAAGLVDREIERTSVALARGAAAELLTQLDSRGTIRAGDWLLPGHGAESVRLSIASPFILCPLVAPRDASLLGDDDAGSLVGLDYALPNAWRAFDGEHPAPASLEALLGPQRAKILLHLDRPTNAGELAQLLHAVPSAATHHLRALEAAGLVARAQSGRRVEVSRTARGTRLLVLYES